MIRDTEDFYTRPGAEKLCTMILSYWQRRGFPGVRARVVLIPHLNAPHFTVESNIVNGFPPRSHR